MKKFFETGAKERVRDAIRAAERLTSAEVVVSVKPASSVYREVDLSIGALLAFAMLCLLMFHPAELDENWFPVAVLGTFVGGVVTSSALAPLKRALVSERRRRDEVARAAREAFVQMGVHGTRGRTGMLLFVSAFEKRAEVVLDIGLDPAALGPEWEAVRTRLEQSVADADLDAFVQSVAGIGPALAARLPRAEDDVNELPDEVH